MKGVAHGNRGIDQLLRLCGVAETGLLSKAHSFEDFFSAFNFCMR